MDLTLYRINKDYEEKILDQYSASELLISLIENSDNEEFRAECVKFLSKIGFNDQKIFKFLENLLISDTSESVRIAAFKAIKKNFLLKAVKPIVWLIENEKSLLLIPLIEALAEIDCLKCKKVLINKIKEFSREKLKISLKNADLERINLEKLKEIFFNHLFNKSLDALYFHRHKIPLAFDFYDFE